MRTEVRTERKINFATFCPDPPIQASSWGGVGVSMCDGDDYSPEAVEVQLQVRSFLRSKTGPRESREETVCPFPLE